MKSGKPHPRFGATKAQSRHFAEVRQLKNRIAELEQQLAAATAHNPGVDYWRQESAKMRGLADGLREAFAILATGESLGRLATGKTGDHGERSL